MLLRYTHDRFHTDTFPAPGFTDERQHFIIIQLKIQPSNGVDISTDEEKRISGIFGEALAGHRSVQKEFLAEALRARDIQMN